MSASFSAFQLGYLTWQVKGCQETVWSEIPGKDIKEVDSLLLNIELALPALADRITPNVRAEITTILGRIRERHRFISEQNITYYCDLLETDDQKSRRFRYQAFLTDETNYPFREFQNQDCHNLRALLATVIKGDSRLEGYYEVGNHFGEFVNAVGRGPGPISQKERAHVLSGMKMLPLREQREIERGLVPAGVSSLVFCKQILDVSRVLKTHEADLVAKPKWDGGTISYRGRSEQVRSQDNSVMAVILDAGEEQQWRDAIQLSPEMMANKKTVANAIQYFEDSHELLEFSVNGDRVLWGAPGTIKKRRAKSV